MGSCYNPEACNPKRICKLLTSLSNIAESTLSLFQTELLRNEFERMQQRLPMDTLSMKRYELPPPPAGKMTDIAAWNECVENSMAQLEHQATR